MNTMIKCLPKEVQGKLRSGVALPSLQQCVEELILNSIDAEATCVGVRMDMEAFKVQVIDNGAGINSEDMDSLGKRYCTSKCSSIEDLDSLRWYGFRGEALASIVSLSTLVEISSRNRSTVKTHVKIFKDGKGMDVFEGETARPSAGTTVIVCNFLHNMPVRRKRVDAVLEGERIRHRVEAISLMHPSVSFTLKNDCTGAMTVQLPKARNTYHRFVQIHSLVKAQKLGEIGYTHGQFEVIGYIGREGHYNNSLQFLYVNERLLLKTKIHKLLNFLLRRLSNSNQKSESPDMQSGVRSPKTKRSQDPHGVYVINIKCSYSEYDICLEPAKTLIEFKDWDGVLLCIEEAVKAFLSRENLVAVISQDDFDNAPTELFGAHITDEKGNNTGNVGQATNSASIMDCSIGMKLASDSVHRKRKDDHLHEEGVSRESSQMVCKEEMEQQGQEKINAKECESEDSLNKDITYEPSCDLAGLNPSSDIQITVEEESSEAGEGSEMFCKSSSIIELESEKLKLSKEKDMLINNSVSNSNETLLDHFTQQIQPDIGQILPVGQGTGGHHHTLEGNRKISLSDPYIHENLLTQGMAQISKSIFQQSCEERCVALKRRISLEAGQDRTGQKQPDDFANNIPSKIPRVAVCQKLSLCKESGSLERFRRVYGKSDELKLSSQENTNRFLQSDGFVMNSQNSFLYQKDQQHGGVAEVGKEKEKLNSPVSPLTLSAFTKLKPASVQNRGKTSLANKLCQLKHQRRDNLKVLPQDNNCLSTGNDDTQGSNNNEQHCDTALNPEPAPVCSTNPLADEREEASGDWLHHYETSVGKTVYVNKVTGLSRYDEMPAEDTQVHCTSDVTNMAVSVINKMDANVESSNSLTTLYSKWKNPVFVRPPMVGVDVTSGQAVGLAVKIHNILFPYRFSKAMIHSMKVIHQVDKKFLACLINTRDEEPAAMTETEGNLLVLVDQHAAHERVRLENLVADSYEEDPDSPGEKRLCSSTILPPLEISVTEEELRLLRSCQGHLRSLGLDVKFSQAAEPQVFVGKVPLCFMEKESNEVRRGRPSVIKPVVEEYLREQIELLRSTGRVRGTLPLTVLKVLASLACHGAIKFNDSLSRDECHSLVASLSSCQLPFQCAHGRPSIAPLVDTLHLDKDEQELQRPNLLKLRRIYKAWQLYGNR
ncbi:DNA mismatch repair protein Mlh3 [Eleginops maclovinus]|uniref:DNA mismatch repair protein Mlh3 n=1 Tax=Eleginops maclovinus TaxID=56733 RepID=UPI0030805FD2